VEIKGRECAVERVVVVAPLAEWVEAYYVARRRAYARYGVSVVLDTLEEQAARASRVALVLGLKGRDILSGVSVHRAMLLEGIDLPSAVMLHGLGLQWAALTPGTVELSGTMRARGASAADVDVMLEVAIAAIPFFGADAVGTAPPHMVRRYGELGFAPSPHMSAFEYPTGMMTTPMVCWDPLRLPGASEPLRGAILAARERFGVWLPEALL
jgi:hypothetical protein